VSRPRGSWRCRACLSVNEPRTRKCGACELPRVAEPKKCVWCQAEYTKNASESFAQWDERVCCSRTCGGERRAALRREAVLAQKKTCIRCGKEFHRQLRRSDSQWEKTQTCSRECAYELRAKKVAATRKRKPVQLVFPRAYRPLVEDGKRVCPKCALRKPIDEFSTKGSTRNGDDRYSYCRPCAAEYQRVRKLANIFGLTVDEDKTLLAYQDGRCAICDRPPGKMRLATDHDHASGLIRGKLCWICNRLLGFVHDNPERLRAAADYLEDPPAVRALGREVYGRKGKTTAKAKRRSKRRAA
jgi:hypothetical protein